jgi:hypothetical protein
MIDPRPSESIRRLATSYSENAILRGAVQTIPVVGSIVDGVLASGRSDLVQQRVAALLDDLREEFIWILREEGVDEEFLRSQDYAHLVLLATEQAARSRTREKIRVYARLLARAGTPEAAKKVDRSEELLHSLADLSLTEVKVLIAFSVQAKHGKVFPASSLVVDGLSEREVFVYCTRLQRTGFVVIRPGEAMIGGTGNPAIEATPFLEDLARLIGGAAK